jgi:hypothetical protein
MDGKLRPTIAGETAGEGMIDTPVGGAGDREIAEGIIMVGGSGCRVEKRSGGGCL